MGASESGMSSFSESAFQVSDEGVSPILKPVSPILKSSFQASTGTVSPILPVSPIIIGRKAYFKRYNSYRSKVKIECRCGKYYTVDHKARHEKSKTHLRYLAVQNSIFAEPPTYAGDIDSDIENEIVFIEVREPIQELKLSLPIRRPKWSGRPGLNPLDM
jgi:hypothetical protein